MAVVVAHPLTLCLTAMPTDTEMPTLPEFAQENFDVFVTALQGAGDDDNKTPLNIQVVSEDGDLAIDWDQDDPAMEFMTLYSEKAISIFVSELIRRAYENLDDFSVETTKEEA